MAFYVEAVAVVREALAFQAFVEEAGAGGHSAGGRVVGAVAEFEAVQAGVVVGPVDEGAEGDAGPCLSARPPRPGPVGPWRIDTRRERDQT